MKEIQFIDILLKAIVIDMQFSNIEQPYRDTLHHRTLCGKGKIKICQKIFYLYVTELVVC